MTRPQEAQAVPLDVQVHSQSTGRGGWRSAQLFVHCQLACCILVKGTGWLLCRHHGTALCLSFCGSVAPRPIGTGALRPVTIDIDQMGCHRSCQHMKCILVAKQCVTGAFWQEIKPLKPILGASWSCSLCLPCSQQLLRPPFPSTLICC
jgi:hypothetical protein